jgi:hypothetical protein
VFTRAREEAADLVLVHHGLPRRRPLRDETFGVRALGERAERLGVRHVFVDVPNPI